MTRYQTTQDRRNEEACATVCIPHDAPIEFSPCSGCDGNLTDDGERDDDNKPVAYCNGKHASECPMQGINVTELQASRLYDRFLQLENKAWKVQVKLDEALARLGVER